MRVLFFTNPLAERLRPLLPLARSLRDQDHEVAFSTAVTMRDLLEPEGFELMLFGATSDEVSAEVSRRAGTDILFLPARDLVTEYFAGARIDLLADEAADRAGAWAPDLVVSEYCDLIGPLVAQALDVPCAVVSTGPSPSSGTLDALADKMAGRYIERGLQPPSQVPWGRWLLDLCPPSLHPQGWKPPLPRVALRAEFMGEEAIPSGPSRASAGERPRVLLGPGTATGAIPGLEALLRSLRTLDIEIAATAGWRTAAGLVRDTWDYAAEGLSATSSLEGASVVLHDGSAEMTFAAAARGIPAVVLPVSPEQQLRAQAVEAAGAGLALRPGHPEPALITERIGRLLGNPRFTDAARRISREMAGMPTATEVGRWLVAAVSGELRPRSPSGRS
ncbi:nucleotide disphospho-sugar-binding domain-containing protein [Streptomyces sp. E5N298]|uniref:glycosyltransferase n=1 Tax=Streptomyces sp. E5N298 TaxID=1851983 RepID=UPI000EF604BC|nr:nucleotide disphospho-sugar-binding domain-containing protein [Streptomyces sp. E5N298]